MARAAPVLPLAPPQNGSIGPARTALLVSSFVLPHSGGVEQFVDTAATVLRRHGWAVRVVACRPAEGFASADVALPSRFLPPGGWPVPLRGWRELWREIGLADVVVANGPRHILPNAAVLAARLRRRSALFVLHGSGAPFSNGSLVYHRLLGSVFELLVSRPALRLSRPVSLSQAGVVGARRRYGVEAAHVAYPLRRLPPAPARTLDATEPIRIVWAGRLYPEKNPLEAVSIVERVRERREATLHVYGEGILAPELARLGRGRPWLVLHGSRSWTRVQDAQGTAHVCLSTSLRDATQVAILEPLARGIPVVSTRVGDAPAHYVSPSLSPFCVEPHDSEAAAAAILELASSYPRYREDFADNAGRLRARHSKGPEQLARLLEEASGRQ